MAQKFKKAQSIVLGNFTKSEKGPCHFYCFKELDILFLPSYHQKLKSCLDKTAQGYFPEAKNLPFRITLNVWETLKAEQDIHDGNNRLKKKTAIRDW